MDYRAVGNRCAVHFESLDLELSREAALRLLFDNGFAVVDVDVCALAEQCVGTSVYHRGARPSQAPAIVDCSSFIKWIYAQRGIWLPRRSIQQREFGVSHPLESAVAGDVIFTVGFKNYYYTDKADGVGHVGIVSTRGTVIHAANSRVHVIETPLEAFVKEGEFRGLRRYVPLDAVVVTLQTPAFREVESADDIRWIVHQLKEPAAKK